jgi:UDP-N-acetylglucosamine 1-carboxyvinyltransferase
LISKDITIPDLRAGFAYVLAALMAPDTSLISGAHYLDRGYENLVDKLVSIGADVSRDTAHQKKTAAAAV